MGIFNSMCFMETPVVFHLSKWKHFLVRTLPTARLTNDITSPNLFLGRVNIKWSNGDTEPPLPSFAAAASRVKVVCVEDEVGAVCRSGFHYGRCPRFKKKKEKKLLRESSIFLTYDNTADNVSRLTSDNKINTVSHLVKQQ